jgi:hypothetical protein
MTSNGPWQGRLLAQASPHVEPFHELAAAMRQIRAAAGDTLEASAAVLNDTLRRLYPDVDVDAPVSSGRYSPPHQVNAGYLSDIERGNNATLRRPKWLGEAGISDTAEAARGSRIQPWLVRAYDAAFGADGYLIDLYAYVDELHTDYQRDPPQTSRHLPARIPGDGEYAYLSDRFPDPPSPVRHVLQAHADELRARRRHLAGESWHWRGGGDETRSVGDGDGINPEGVIVHPGEYRVHSWKLQNVGTRPWRDRIMYRIGQTGSNIVSPPFIPLADAAPGDWVDIRCPWRAPERPGTYRLCLKMGWPNGVYCFPKIVSGIHITCIVPAADLADCYSSWGYR